MATDQPLVPPQTWRVIDDPPAEIPQTAVHLGNGVWAWPGDRPEGEWFIPAAPREDS